MKPALKLKLCNRRLGWLLILTLVSAIQLEITSGKYVWSVWVHIALGIALTILSLYHIYLHYRCGNWFSRFAKNKHTVTRILWWTFLLTSVSGIAATFIWLDGHDHSHLGAVHGKIGFLMALTAIVHAVRHRKNMTRKNS